MNSFKQWRPSRSDVEPYQHMFEGKINFSCGDQTGICYPHHWSFDKTLSMSEKRIKKGLLFFYPKDFSCFWLAQIPGLILHNQLPWTKFGRPFTIIMSIVQYKCQKNGCNREVFKHLNHFSDLSNLLRFSLPQIIFLPAQHMLLN